MKRLLFSLPICATLMLSACSSTDNHTWRITHDGWVDMTPPSKTQAALTTAGHVMQALSEGLDNAMVAYGEGIAANESHCTPQPQHGTMTVITPGEWPSTIYY
jgi:hypothetical protein